MNIKTIAVAGTLESSDISVVIEPRASQGIILELKSIVEKQYGEQIEKVVMETLKEMGITSAIVKLNDKGALDCVIKARVQTAVLRASRVESYQWGEGKSCTN